MSDLHRDALRLDDLVTSNPGIMAGRRVFRGTRVPVEVLFENLADGIPKACLP